MAHAVTAAAPVHALPTSAAMPSREHAKSERRVSLVLPPFLTRPFAHAPACDESDVSVAILCGGTAYDKNGPPSLARAAVRATRMDCDRTVRTESAAVFTPAYVRGTRRLRARRRVRKDRWGPGSRARARMRRFAPAARARARRFAKRGRRRWDRPRGRRGRARRRWARQRRRKER